MTDTKILIERAYAAFNERNVDGAVKGSEFSLNGKQMHAAHVSQESAESLDTTGFRPRGRKLRLGSAFLPDCPSCSEWHGSRSRRRPTC